MPTLTLRSSKPDGAGLHLVRFDETLEGFVSPGQFVTIHLPGHKPAYFALASVPGAPVELLVKVQGDTAEALVELAPGTAVECSDPIGSGFPLPEGDTRPLVVLATGSGISAVRSVLEAEVAAGLPRPVTLLYGVFTLAHRSMISRLEAWADAGIDVRVVLSEPHDGWKGLTGFVQQAAADAGLVDADSTVVLCGYPAMVEEAKALWLAAGADADRLLVNF